MATDPCSGVVLLVEDDDDTRELLTTVLERRGYLVATAENGGAALALLGRIERVCFVLLDLFMPEMDGFAVLRTIQGNPALARLPLCVSTSAPDLAPVGVACLPKPIDLTRLFALLEQHCDAPHSVTTSQSSLSK